MFQSCTQTFSAIANFSISSIKKGREPTEGKSKRLTLMRQVNTATYRLVRIKQTSKWYNIISWKCSKLPSPLTDTYKPSVIALFKNVHYVVFHELNLISIHRMIREQRFISAIKIERIRLGNLFIFLN